MKKFLAFIAAIISFISCATVIPKKGNGILVTSEETVPEFTKINISGGYTEVRFYASKEYRLIVTVDSNLKEYVKIEVRNNILNIGTERGSYVFTKYLVDVYCPSLAGVSVSGLGSFSAKDKIIASSFEATVSGVGDLTGTIECKNYSAVISGSGKINTDIVCDKLSSTISGSGDITIVGTANNSNITISGSGNFNGIEFKTNNVTAHISGSGDMSVWALENIDATVSGSGSIKYCGNPKINFNGSGSGRISHDG